MPIVSSQITRRTPYTLKVASLPHAIFEQPMAPPQPLTLKQALEEFGHELVMAASDDCRVLPHVLRLLGKGGEHVVFEDVRFPNYVLKVDFIESLPMLYAQARGEDAIKKEEARLRDKATNHHQRLARLQSYFSAGTVPLELVAVKNIPLNESVVLALMRDRNIEIPARLVVPKSMDVLCTLQHKIDLDKKSCVDIYSSYAELNRTILLDFYVEGHRLLSSSEAIGPADALARRKIILYTYPSLRTALEKMDAETGIKSALRDYIGRAMRYAVDTGEIIDMAGGGNVLLRKDEDGVWGPYLMDVLSPPELNLDLIRQAAAMIKHGQEMDVRMRANVLNVINFVRFANALAILSDSGERLDVRGMNDVTPEQWHDGLMIEKYLDTYTPKQKT